MFALRLCVLRALLVACVSFLPMSAASISFTNVKTFTVPFGANLDQVSINDKGDISGTSFSSVPFVAQAGFVIPGNGGTPIQIKAPNAQYTFVNGIDNQGAVVGFYFASDNLIHGFTYTGGVFAPVSAGPYTYAEGLNNSGDITGYFSTIGDTATGFLLKNGVQTTFFVPGFPLGTFPTGVNNSDQIVGYTSGQSGFSGFLRLGDGTLQTLDFSPSGLNNAGIIVGDGIGSNNTSVGIVNMGGADFSYIFPGAVNTYFGGINSSNQIVGFYSNPGGTEGIFEGTLAVSPEPSTVSVCGVFLFAGLLFVQRRAKTANDYFLDGSPKQ